MKGIETSVKDGVRIITFNRPERKNALSILHYQELARILNEDATSNETVVTIITGTGDYFTSGNDIKASMESADAGIVGNTEKFKTSIDALINYPKILIAVVNGPAIGFGTTMLGLCDIVYASDRATFYLPFINLGLCAEACASYTFPRIMGKSKACEMILLGKKISVQDAYNFGLVAEIIPHNELNQFMDKLQGYGKLSLNVVRKNKRIMSAHTNKILCESNNLECETLKGLLSSDEFVEGVVKFMSRKSKL